MKRKIVSVMILALSVAMIAAGAARGDMKAVFEKGSRICLECIGLA